MSNYLGEIILQLKAFIKIYILRDKKNYFLYKWYLAKGERKLRYNYPLNGKSIVFDVGGYVGEFTNNIDRKYKSQIYFFEPIDEFFEIALNKFKGRNNIKLYKSGLGSETRTELITLDGAASSAIKKSSESRNIFIKSIVEFMDENNIRDVDLIKINIEGMEYELLDKVLANNRINFFKNIQVQFHNFNYGDDLLRDKIRSRLAITHYPTYEYPFVWENWRLK